MSWTSENYSQKRLPGSQKIDKTKNICSIVMILVNCLDSIITIILQKFQTLETSITRKVILFSSKKLWLEIINGIDKWRTGKSNVTIVV